jgi:hypothetical protein
MKYLKNVDFAGQTIIIGGYAIAAAWVLIENSGKNSLAMNTAFAMLCLGWWQMISALLMLVVGAPNQKLRLVHFFTAIGYLMLVVVEVNYLDLDSIHPIFLNHFIQLLWITLLYATPVILALLYYYLTWRLVFPTKPSGKFLPHISF